MNRAHVPVFLLLLAGLAGCLGGDEAGPAGSDDASDEGASGGNQTFEGPSGNETSLPIRPVVTITNHSATVAPDQEILVAWNVVEADNRSATLGWTAVLWADASVEDPEDPADYGNETMRAEGGELPVALNVTFFAGDLNGTTVYLRAYALVEGVAAWSDEVTVTVEAPADPTIHEVTIGGVGTGPAADYSPVRLAIAAGDAVVWVNDDGAGHTATDRDGAWDTGSIAGGASSAPIVFETAGTFLYECAIHPTMLGGMIEVS